MTSKKDDHGMDWLSQVHSRVDRSLVEVESAASAARLSLFNVVRSAFDHQLASGKTSRRAIAARLGVSTSLVGRLLLKPSNMTIETAAKILFAMGRELRVISPEPPVLHVGLRPAAQQHVHSPGQFAFVAREGRTHAFMSGGGLDSDSVCWRRSASSSNVPMPGEDISRSLSAAHTQVRQTEGAC